MVDEVVNLHSNAPVKLEMLLVSTENIWFRSWPGSVTDPRLGTSPAECFSAANGIELVDVLALGLAIADRACAGQLEFCRAGLVGAGATDATVTLLLKHMALSVPEFQRRLARDRRKGDIADQRYTLTRVPSFASMTIPLCCCATSGASTGSSDLTCTGKGSSHSESPNLVRSQRRSVSR